MVSTPHCRKDLDRDRAIEACVASLIDFAHPAGTDGGDDLVPAETSARGYGQRKWLGL